MSPQSKLVILFIILILTSDYCHTTLKPPSLLRAPTFAPKLNAFDSLQLWVREQLCKTSSARGMKDEVLCDVGEERTCSKAHCLCLPLPSSPDPFLQGSYYLPSPMANTLHCHVDQQTH